MTFYSTFHKDWYLCFRGFNTGSSILPS